MAFDFTVGDKVILSSNGKIGQVIDVKRYKIEPIVNGVKKREELIECTVKAEDGEIFENLKVYEMHKVNEKGLFAKVKKIFRKS